MKAVTDNAKSPVLWRKVVVRVDLFTKFAIIVREGVQRTETFFILRTYKLSYRWGMSPEDEAALLSEGAS